MRTPIDDAWSFTVSALRFGRGRSVRHGGVRRRPEKLIEVWEFEACPFSRKLRERMSELDLDWICHPTALGSNLREQTPDHEGGQKSYPHMRDPNTGAELHESEAIVDYLHHTYGPGRPHADRLLERFNTYGSIVASYARLRGLHSERPDRVQPPSPLELYQYEGCPYCRKVRERLNEQNLTFIVRNVAKRSKKRARLIALGGRMQVPFLVDPNTGAAMYESNDIRRYLDEMYG